MNQIVWSCGGGRQSAGIAALIVAGRLPVPDIAVIVDTEYEKESTWAYYETVLKPQLALMGCDLVRIVKSDYATVGLYGGKSGGLLIPAFSTQEGSIGKLPAFCSNEWKQRVVRRYLRARGVRQCEMWLGISTNEADRMKDSDLQWITNAYPLINLGFSAQDCFQLVQEIGWPEPPRSSCYMCPNQGKAEWDGMSDADYERARQFEADIREKDSFVYLTRMAKPLPADRVVQATFESLDNCGGFCFV